MLPVLTKFPDISYYLSSDSNCSRAQSVNGGRNLAKVMLDIYNAIPPEMTEFRQSYCEKVDFWLKDDVFYRAPEVFPNIVWRDAQNLMKNLFTPFKEFEWADKCRKIFCNQV